MHISVRITHRHSDRITRMSNFNCLPLYFTGCATTQTVIDAYRIICQSTIDERTAVACFKSDTDEIVGVSIVTILSRDDHVEKQILAFVSINHVNYS